MTAINKKAGDTTHDEATGASYVYVCGGKVVKTVQVTKHCNVDIDEDGFPVGIEVLSALQESE